jgi:hypothetical protein
MSSISVADIVAGLQRLDDLIRQGLQDGTILNVMKENKAEMVSNALSFDRIDIL